MSAVAFDPTLRGAGCRNKDSGKAAVCPPGVGRGHERRRNSSRKKRGRGRSAHGIAVDTRLTTGCRRLSTGRAARCPPGVGRTPAPKHHGKKSNVVYHSKSSNKSRTPKQKAALEKLIAHNRSSAGRAKLSRALKGRMGTRIRRNKRARSAFRRRARSNLFLRSGTGSMGSSSSLLQRRMQRRLNAQRR